MKLSLKRTFLRHSGQVVEGALLRPDKAQSSHALAGIAIYKGKVRALRSPGGAKECAHPAYFLGINKL